jgi:RimJ/RimL family protein N-acetyltransferase
VRESVQVHPLRRRERNAALACLKSHSRENLFLIDLVARLGSAPAPGEPRAELLAAWSGDALVGIASLRPTLCLGVQAEDEAIEALLPFVERLSTGLVKSDARAVAVLWGRLAARGRRALVDRLETARLVEPAEAPACAAPDGVRIRPARLRDLDALVYAARASLREENRPDPFEGDPEGFLRWVRGRIRNALVAELDGTVAFVGYADVLRPEGCLVQGVYTWPRFRRRGLASAGISALCDRAFAAGADHVQLAVVDGNRAGERLYERLGFRPFSKLRTILFT